MLSLSKSIGQSANQKRKYEPELDTTTASTNPPTPVTSHMKLLEAGMPSIPNQLANRTNQASKSIGRASHTFKVGLVWQTSSV